MIDPPFHLKREIWRSMRDRVVTYLKQPFNKKERLFGW